MADEPELPELERRPRGRPRGQTRKDEDRGELRTGEVLGRNGEVLTRSHKGGIDPFENPNVHAPKGWKYQWNTVAVYNNSDVVADQVNQMFGNAWRPVPADRHPGIFTPVGATGSIVRGGQRLEERPKQLDDEARAEDIASARRQMRDRDESLMGAKANLRGALHGGFEMDPGRYRGTGGNLRMTIDPGVDIPSPSYKIADE